MRRQSGFTLIEIAIVLVIIGLLLGGVLKGQELIQSARVRNLVSLQDGVKAAFFGFQDRFRAYPGDYSGATANINGSTVNGDGDGQIELAGTGTAVREDVAVWEHLSRAGFMNGSYTYNATPSAATSPTNPYGIVLQLIYDNVYADAAATPPNKHNLKTGNQVPADIIAELDRKIDDGNAQLGSFRFSVYTQGGTAPTAANCHTAGVWKITGGSVESNCGGSNLF
jgi:prepilin-type N-terminal cleavage/methylation domain-containing protein